MLLPSEMVVTTNMWPRSVRRDRGGSNPAHRRPAVPICNHGNDYPRSAACFCDPESAYPRPTGGVAGSRYYSPNFGRWMSRDPITEGAALTRPLNFGRFGNLRLNAGEQRAEYVFVGNEPCSRFDPHGMLAWGSHGPYKLVPGAPPSWEIEGTWWQKRPHDGECGNDLPAVLAWRRTDYIPLTLLPPAGPAFSEIDMRVHMPFVNMPFVHSTRQLIAQ